MLDIKKALTKILSEFKPSAIADTVNTNNGTLTYSVYRIGIFAIGRFTVHTSSSWGTGASNRITATVGDSVKSNGYTFTGCELNGINAHLAGSTFRAQNNTGTAMAADSNYDISIVYIISR